MGVFEYSFYKWWVYLNIVLYKWCGYLNKYISQEYI